MEWHLPPSLLGIVNRLSAIEEMAGLDIQCSDKTGTTPENAIHVADVKAFLGITENLGFGKGTIPDLSTMQYRMILRFFL
ncbi:MAG: hypothetical protein METHP_01212 [Methanoregula sp. SKADARSKE-2]|nr:MAG: hypothetical protein METHP_01212 [Methanoregula sp. SKADARSKE-2]